MNKLSILILFFLSVPYLAEAQKKTPVEVRAEIWGRNSAEFTNTSVPEKWKNESAVILLQDYRYTFDKKVGNLFTENIYHTRVALLDKNAVKEFSEFSFYEKFYGTSSYSQSQGTTYTGFKIIKPDGTENIVNIGTAVEIETQDTRETRKKIAIPNLEEGDIIDYYFYEKEIIPLSNAPTYAFSPVLTTLNSGYPTQFLRRQFIVENKFYINYKPTNGAPSLDTRDEGKLKVFTVEVEDLEKTEDTDWTYVYRTVPTIKFQVVYARNKALAGGLPNFLDITGKVKTEVSRLEINGMFKKIVAPSERFDNIGFIEYLKKKGLDEKKMKRLELAEEVYFYLQHKNIGAKLEAYFLGKGRAPGISDYGFVAKIEAALKKYDIESEVLMLVDRSINTIDDLVLWQEIGLLIRVKDEDQILYLENFTLHSNINRIPTKYEGTEAYVYPLTSAVKGTNETESIWDSYIKNLKKEILPTSKAEENRLTLFTKASLDEDLEKVIMNNKYEATGHNKDWYQGYMQLYDYQIEEDFEYGNKPYIQSVKKKEKTIVAQEIQEYKEKSKKNIQESLEGFVENNYKAEEAEVENFKILKTGRFKEPVFSFEFDTKVEGLIQQAGPNYLLNIGILITSQREVEEKDMTRDVDIYMPSARSYVNEIEFQIPAGYSVEGIEKLQKNIKNETGGFVSSAKIKGDKLLINVEKWYSSNYEPAKNWGLMLEFLEAGYEFTKEKILLKKI